MASATSNDGLSLYLLRIERLDVRRGEAQDLVRVGGPGDTGRPPAPAAQRSAAGLRALERPWRIPDRSRGGRGKMISSRMPPRSWRRSGRGQTPLRRREALDQEIGERPDLRRQVPPARVDDVDVERRRLEIAQYRLQPAGAHVRTHDEVRLARDAEALGRERLVEAAVVRVDRARDPDLALAALARRETTRRCGSARIRR